MAATLLLSDLHLSPAQPRAVAAFLAFARGPARRASAVYILGDLFDWWVGDDQLRNRFYRRIGDALRGIHDAGVPLFVARGNRDFLIGAAFAEATGATLLDERTVRALGGVRTLLTHGDELCTDDLAYMRFRARSRTQAWRDDILRKPYWLRRVMAWMMRAGSRAAVANKPESIMDVNDAAVAQAFRTHGVTRLVHGHTHRPARHALEVDGVACERHVLAAWHDEGHYLEIDERGVRVRRVDAATS